MKILHKLLLIILVLLAIASGVSKILMMPQEVEFFGAYGFNKTHLLIFGVIQVLAGIALLIKKFRVVGAIALASSFIMSAIVLAISGNIAVTVITLLFVLLLGVVIHNTITNKNHTSSE